MNLGRLRKAALDWKSAWPYVMASVISALVLFALGSIVLMLVSPDDVVVIEVVPIGASQALTVQVAGDVRSPGVYTLAPGSTVDDAITAAGGALGEGSVPDAERASLLVDGQYVFVAPPVAGTAAPGTPVDINAATAEELETLPGIGPVLAERVIAYREAFGPFESIDELVEISGISSRMVDEMRALVVVGS